MKLTKMIISRIWWLSRGTATLMGLAMLLALTVGLASTALAGTGVGARFDLGQTNAVDALTKLVGTTNNALLRVDNDSKGPNATALELRTDPKKPPMRVSSLTKVENLHADLLDGRSADQFANGFGGTAVNADNLDGRDSADFLPKDVYIVTDQGFGPGDGSVASKAARCDQGDRILGGGGGTAGGEAPIFSAAFTNPPSSDDGWAVQVRDDSPASFIIARAICADLPPLR